MKIHKLLFILMILLLGCQEKSEFVNSITNEQLQNYRSYYNLTLSANGYQTKSQYFEIETTMTSVEEVFRYDIFIHNPKVEMKNVLVMVVEDNTIYDIQKEMMPNVGIFNDVVQLYPYQSNPNLGYYKGINLNRIVENASVNLKIYIQFDSGESNQTIKQFFNFDVQS